MKTKVFFPKRPFDTPLTYRFLEGLTTFSMPLGFLVGGGPARSILFLFYIVHSLASFAFHLFPSALTYLIDISLIDLMCMERIYTISRNLGVYVFYLVYISMNDTKTAVGVIIRIAWASLFSPRIASVYYICMVLLMFITFLQSCQYSLQRDAFKTTLTCCLFHLYLGCVSYMETVYYNWDHTPYWMENTFRYGSYLLFAFYTAMYMTEDKRQLQCVLSFLTSLVLTPLSLYETWVQYRTTPAIPHTDNLQENIVLFYITYCVMDMVLGYHYYREYFQWIEGIAHHVGTLCFASYFLWSGKSIHFCIGLIEETPSIFLNLSRLFPHILLFKKIFHVLFLLFRVVLPLCVLYYMPFLQTDKPSMALFSVMLVMNLYWLSKQLAKRKKLKHEKEA